MWGESCFKTSTSGGKTVPKKRHAIHTEKRATDEERISATSSNSIPDLRLYQNTHAGVRQLQSGHTVLEGDTIQIQYSTQAQYGIIISVDGRGTVSQHFPDEGIQSTHIQSGRHVLPFAFELDDAPGYEIFFFISSNKSISLEDIRKEVQKTKTVHDTPQIAGDGIHIKRVVLHKMPRE